MSLAFIRGIEKTFETTQITFDRFHIMKIINHAVDQVRHEEQKDRPDLKNSRYLWLKNPQHLTDQQHTSLESRTMKTRNLKIVRAYLDLTNDKKLFYHRIQTPTTT